jgi:hypothetical protein
MLTDIVDKTADNIDIMAICHIKEFLIVFMAKYKVADVPESEIKLINNIAMFRIR